VGGSGLGGSGGGTSPITLKKIGQPCAERIDCESKFCVDGVCCSTACDGVCTTCAAPGAAGKCTQVVADGPARPGECTPAAGSGKCGNTGACDGAGACQRPPAGAICAGQTCEGFALSAPSQCDGFGNCLAGPSVSCSPYACAPSGDQCRTTCDTDADCVNSHCVNGLCFRSLVAPCTQDQECASGFCADGVCCNGPCRGPCLSCLLPGSLGTCTPVPAGVPDTRALCRDLGAASCLENGRCDGRGGCQRYAPGTFCTAPRCQGNFLTLAGTCTPLGTCVAPVQDCAPYTCLPDVPMCGGGCPAGDSVCAPGAYCSGNEVCMLRKAAGAPCASDHECVSNTCRPAGDGGASTCAP
jgi:hypothetical protein